MKYIGKKSLSACLKTFIILVMVTAIIVILGLPMFFKMYLKWLGLTAKTSYNFLLIVLYITGISSLLLLNELRKIFNTLENADPFILENARSLKRISNFSFLIGLIYISKIFILNSFMTLIIIFIFIICGFFALILSEVFKQAVRYKEDNDLTI